MGWGGSYGPFKNISLISSRFIEIVSYCDTFLIIRVSYRGAGIVVPDDTPTSTISKEDDSLTYFKTIFITNFKDLKCY